MTPSDADLIASCAAFMGWGKCHYADRRRKPEWVDSNYHFMQRTVGGDAFNPLTRPADWAMLLDRLEELGIEHDYEFRMVDGKPVHTFLIWIGGSDDFVRAPDPNRAHAVCLAIFEHQQAKEKSGP